MSQWGWETPLSEHVYCMVIAFKMTEQVPQQICIKFCIKLEHSSVETIQMIQKGKLWATSYWQLHHDKTLTHTSRLMQSFLVKQPTTQVTQTPYSPDLAPCDFWLSPTKIILKRKKFQTVNEIQEYTME